MPQLLSHDLTNVESNVDGEQKAREEVGNEKIMKRETQTGLGGKQKKVSKIVGRCKREREEERTLQKGRPK